MAQEANVKVRLDTKQAKSELRGLNKLASGSVARIGGGVRSGLNAIGLGGIGGASVGALKGSISSGAEAIISGQLAPIINRVNAMLFGQGAIEARATEMAFAKTFTPQAMRRVHLQGGPSRGDHRLFGFHLREAMQQLEGERDLRANRAFMTLEGKFIDTRIEAAKSWWDGQLKGLRWMMRGGR